MLSFHILYPDFPQKQIDRIDMVNTFLLITKSVQGNDISGISVLNASERLVFPFLDFFCRLFILTVQRICHLNIGILLPTVPDNEIAFQISDPSDTHLIIMAGQIQKDDIFKRRAITQPVISID